MTDCRGGDRSVEAGVAAGSDWACGEARRGGGNGASPGLRHMEMSSPISGRDTVNGVKEVEVGVTTASDRACGEARGGGGNGASPGRHHLEMSSEISARDTAMNGVKGAEAGVTTASHWTCGEARGGGGNEASPGMHHKEMSSEVWGRDAAMNGLKEVKTQATRAGSGRGRKRRPADDASAAGLAQGASGRLKRRCPASKPVNLVHHLDSVPPRGRLLVEEHFKASELACGQDRYREWDQQVLRRLRARVENGVGADCGAAAVKAREDFVKVVLKGEGDRGTRRQGPSEERMLKVILAYIAVLKQAYPDLVVDPYIVNTDPDSCADFHALRMASKRFIIYRQPNSPASSFPTASPPDSIPGSPSTSGTSRAVPWTYGLSRLWDTVCTEFGDTKYGDLKQGTQGIMSKACNLMTTRWECGEVLKQHVLETTTWSTAVLKGVLGSWGGRLYLTDGVLPHDEKGAAKDAPGLVCHVNDAANGMLPEFLRSNRPDSLMHFMKVESSGTATFSFFCPLGGGCQLTAFHQETKRMRSFNCGSGDLIVQPIATEANIRRLERVHSTLFRSHKRHRYLLPLDMYLEEGIPLVLYIRNSQSAEMVELPFLSTHAFLTFTSATSQPPAYKVSCNDLCLTKEPFVAYAFEELAMIDGETHMMGGNNQLAADEWMESAYFAMWPPGRGVECAWDDELLGSTGPPSEGDRPRDRNMRTVVVRTVQRLLDLLEGRLDTSRVAGSVPSTDEALAVLAGLLPCLLDVSQELAKGVGEDGAQFVKDLCETAQRHVPESSPLLAFVEKGDEQCWEEMLDDGMPANGSVAPQGQLDAWLDRYACCLDAELRAARSGCKKRLRERLLEVRSRLEKRMDEECLNLVSRLEECSKPASQPDLLASNGT
ncbi:unnamed protein product [Ostreobium quekettii]|uniref:Uncharacterized protein n=1 Tax=Ostreobium quekettii TaxID=121088 RepID=A0A8S1JER2_9CHLO|nr:unnamed protein product [Ostreobium quekettii]